MNATESRDMESFRQRLASIDETVIAWFSGWLSADGSVKISDQRGRPSIRFQICDRDPLDRFAEVFGNRVGGPFPQGANAFGTRPVYEWKITGARAVLLLGRCLPWLSERYAARARSAMRYETSPHAGRKLTPDDVAEIKRELAVGVHGTGRRLAKRYGVSEGMISAIRSGRAW